MNKTKLAQALNISRQMIYKLLRQGMPADSIESARQWRKKALNPYKTKEYRVGLMEARIKIRSERLNQS